MTKLTRPKEGRIIGGVCQGIANAVDVDVTIVRIAMAALVLIAGAGPLIYIAAWIIIPDESKDSSLAEDAVRGAWNSWENRKRTSTPTQPTTSTQQGPTFNPYDEN
ncbi:PspC domain-containing protein [Acidipropionibacterium timonense]|uniref:PspC domain-containing protein n=1 Tax=Acidipropionibacterium timonense TaxID=2161818 RepID=UPI00103109E8|nr:PspC domain-containing protein [Acidipropionibacterium timonense]